MSNCTNEHEGGSKKRYLMISLLLGLIELIYSYKSNYDEAVGLT